MLPKSASFWIVVSTPRFVCTSTYCVAPLLKLKPPLT